MTVKTRITPCLWFDTQAEEAARFYTSIFPNSGIGAISHYGDGAPMPKGTVLTVAFTLDGQPFLALNGGPMFKFTEAISLTVNCESQQEIDHYWSKLTAGGGKEVQCGWLKDKYGLSWQVVTTRMEQMMRDPDPARSARVWKVVMQSVKLDVAQIERAYAGEAP